MSKLQCKFQCAEIVKDGSGALVRLELVQLYIDDPEIVSSLRQGEKYRITIESEHGAAMNLGEQFKRFGEQLERARGGGGLAGVDAPPSVIDKTKDTQVAPVRQPEPENVRQYMHPNDRDAQHQPPPDQQSTQSGLADIAPHLSEHERRESEAHVKALEQQNREREERARDEEKHRG